MSECRTFCFTDLDGSTLAWGVSPIAVMTFALLICTVWETKTKLNSTDPWFVKLTYISIISAMIIYLVIIIVSEVIYFVYIKGSNIKNYCSSQPAQSIVQFVLYCIESFLLETTVLWVPTNWFINNRDYFQNMIQTAQLDQQEKFSIKSVIKFSVRSLRALIFYFGIMVMLLILMVYAFSNRLKQSISQFRIWICWKVEGVILVLVLILGLRSLHSIQHMLQEKEYKRMRSNYFQLIGCILVRIVIELTYTFIPTSQSIAVQIIFFYIDAALAVYLPILVILRMYRLERVASAENSGTSSPHQSIASSRNNNPDIRLMDIDTQSTQSQR